MNAQHNNDNKKEHTAENIKISHSSQDRNLKRNGWEAIISRMKGYHYLKDLRKN